MGVETGISWCDHTWSPWYGCSKVSAGCASCYAESGSKRNPGMLGIWGPNGTRRVASEGAWRKLILWDRAARELGVRRRVFPSWCDPFEEWDGPMVDSCGRRMYVAPTGVWCPDHMGSPVHSAGWQPLTMDHVRTRFFRRITETPNLDYLVLTKRPANASHWLVENVYGPAEFGDWTLTGDGGGIVPNVWIGVSLENQEWADDRVPKLLEIPAAVLFLSVEPMLGPIDLSRYINGIDWVIVGGESGSKARPMHPSWPISVRDQCVGAGVPYFFKQWGEWQHGSHPKATSHIVLNDGRHGRNPQETGWSPAEYNAEAKWNAADPEMMARVGKGVAGNILDGRVWAEFPGIDGVTS